MPTSNSQFDVLIVGGGVIGLSLAWELGQQGVKTCVVDGGKLGAEASWAGAGMIPPGPQKEYVATASPLEQLAGLSQQLHPQWHQRLIEATGIDNGYRLNGTLYLAAEQSDAVSLREKMQRWQQLGIACHSLDVQHLADLEPAIAGQTNRLAAAYVVPEEAQFRSPWNLRALASACRLQGVDLRPGVTVHEFATEGGRITSALTSDGPLHAGQLCLTAGCWSGQLASSLGFDLPIRPVRGQIVLVDGPAQLLRRNVYVGERYLTPREDGRLLVGSTQEEAGYLKQNTVAATADLTRFATSLIPALVQQPIERCWSGLRPATVDGLPYLGRLGQLQNGWIAAGHFRAGLQLAPATAVVMRDLLLEKKPAIDVSSLGVAR